MFCEPFFPIISLVMISKVKDRDVKEMREMDASVQLLFHRICSYVTANTAKKHHLLGLINS